MGKAASTIRKGNSVQSYLASLDAQTAQDAQTILEMMQRISKSEPSLWNVGTIGFDTYHYKYSSGREGDGLVIGFYPRKGKITVYLMDGTTRYAALLTKLGLYSSTGYCLYIKQLSDIDLPTLERILRQSYTNIKALSKKGPIDRILWQKKK